MSVSSSADGGLPWRCWRQRSIRQGVAVRGDRLRADAAPASWSVKKPCRTASVVMTGPSMDRRAAGRGGHQLRAGMQVPVGRGRVDVSMAVDGRAGRRATSAPSAYQRAQRGHGVDVAKIVKPRSWDTGWRLDAGGGQQDVERPVRHRAGAPHRFAGGGERGRRTGAGTAASRLRE